MLYHFNRGNWYSMNMSKITWNNHVQSCLYMFILQFWQPAIQQRKHCGHWSLWPAQIFHMISCPETSLSYPTFFAHLDPLHPAEGRLSIFWFKILSSSRISSFRANMTRLYLTRHTWTGKTRSNIHNLQNHTKSVKLITNMCVFNHHVSLPGRSSTSRLNNISTYFLHLKPGSMISNSGRSNTPCMFFDLKVFLWVEPTSLGPTPMKSHEKDDNTPWSAALQQTRWNQRPSSIQPRFPY